MKTIVVTVDAETLKRLVVAEMKRTLPHQDIGVDQIKVQVARQKKLSDYEQRWHQHEDPEWEEVYFRASFQLHES